jgi:hypothetical protein
MKESGPTLDKPKTTPERSAAELPTREQVIAAFKAEDKTDPAVRDVLERHASRIDQRRDEGESDYTLLREDIDLYFEAGFGDEAKEMCSAIITPFGSPLRFGTMPEKGIEASDEYNMYCFCLVVTQGLHPLEK